MDIANIKRDIIQFINSGVANENVFFHSTQAIFQHLKSLEMNSWVISMNWNF